eukprot:5864935-Amphidinium_carterae.1
MWKTVLDYRTSTGGCARTSLELGELGRKSALIFFPWRQFCTRQGTGGALAVGDTVQRKRQSGYTIASSLSFVGTMCAAIAASSQTVWTSQWCCVDDIMPTSQGGARPWLTQRQSRQCLPVMTGHLHPEKETSLGETFDRRLENRPIKPEIRVDDLMMDTNVCTYHLGDDRRTDIIVCLEFPCNLARRTGQGFVWRESHLLCSQHLPSKPFASPRTALTWIQPTKSLCQIHLQTVSRLQHKSWQNAQLNGKEAVNLNFTRVQQQVVLASWSQENRLRSPFNYGGLHNDVGFSNKEDKTVLTTTLMGATTLSHRLTIPGCLQEFPSHLQSGNEGATETWTWLWTCGQALFQDLLWRAMSVTDLEVQQSLWDSVSAVATGDAQNTWWHQHAWMAITRCADTIQSWKPALESIGIASGSTGTEDQENRSLCQASR